MALDLATTTGFAHSSGKSGTVSFLARRGESPGMKFFEFRSWLVQFISGTPTDLICYEQSGYHRSNAATHSAHGLIAVTELVCTEFGIELTNRSPNEIKNFACPEMSAAKVKKAHMMRAADNKWPNVDFSDDNEIDAVFLLDLIETQLGLDYGSFGSRKIEAEGART